ncbi:MAG: NfeD family protein, partial [Planctomycetota bacterium]
DTPPTEAADTPEARPAEHEQEQKLPRRKTFDRTKPHKAVLVEATGPVTNMMATTLRRKLEQARTQEVDVVIIRIDTYGGLVAAAEEIIELFRDETELYILAYVDRKAISAGTMMALACDEIVIHRNGRMGDCMPIVIDPQTGSGKRVGAKAESYLQTQFRQMARDNGYNPALAESFVNPDIEILEVVDKETGETTFAKRRDLETRVVDGKKAIEGVEIKRIVVRKDELLTMTAQEAKALGFASQIVDDDGDVFDHMGIRGQVPTLKSTPTEIALIWLTPYAPLLFSIGLLSLYLAVRTPGTGVPELICALSFVAFFTIQGLAGHEATWGLLLFLAGVVLLCVEVFVIPGFGIVGISGLACIGLGLVVSMIPEGFSWKYDANMEILWSILLRSLLTLLGTMVLAMLLTMLLPKTPFGKPFILEQSIDDITVVDDAEQQLEQQRGSTVLKDSQNKPLEGKTGLTLSDLRPSGVARIDGKRMDVVTEGEFITKGAEVVVSKVESMRVFVRQAPKT